MGTSEQLVPGVVYDRLKRGEVGVFPAKNGYMLAGLGTPDLYRGTCDRIRRLKQKRVCRPLARVSTKENLLQQVTHCSPASTALVTDTLHLPIIWSLTTSDFPETCHTIPEVGITAARNPWETAVTTGLAALLVASSANLSGQPTPWDINSIASDILGSADFVFDVGDLPRQPDYAVIHLPDLTVYRDSPVVTTLNEHTQA